MANTRVLIIDDEPDVGEFIAEVAEASGLAATVTADHTRFADEYGESRPQVVITDLQMPGVDGVEVLRFLAGQDPRPKVILLSGFDRRVIASAQRLGTELGLEMLGALQKPVSVRELRSLFESTAPPRSEITEAELRAAIAAGQLLFHYQPKLELGGGASSRVTGVEALARWQHPERGLLMPGDFIPLAERTGAIAEATDILLDVAFAQLRLWREEGLDLSVALNLAPQLINHLDYPDLLAHRAADAGCDPGSIVLEITESRAMDDTASVVDILTRLRLKGFALSIDDFGTGYSSLVQLYRMPFSELKIDKSFVTALASSKEAEAIVRVLVDLAHKLSLSVCAEGIEDEHAWRLLCSLGCDRAQGYFMSRPLPAADVSPWIASWPARIAALAPRQGCTRVAG